MYNNIDLLLNYSDFENEQEFKDIFLEFSDEGLVTKSLYEQNIWCLRDDFQHENRNINFSISDLVINHNPDVIGYLKAWTIQSLEEGFSVSGIQSKVHNVIKAINLSQYFNPQLYDNFTDTYLNSNDSSTILAERVSDLLLFLDFVELEIPDMYFELLIELNSRLKRENNIRILPNTKDILKFSMCVEDYFSNSKELEYDFYAKYYPIYLWWRITNIIPMRIVEFCNIPHKCIEQKNDMYYLVFKRSKIKGQRQKKIDKIPIPIGIVELIEDYKATIGVKSPFEQLIFFRSTVHQPNSNKIVKKKTLQSPFNPSDFKRLLLSFYNRIVIDHYGYKIIEGDNDNTSIIGNKIINKRVLPNDTRHFAFLNLMLQGYHPSEIARLGGHKSIYSQYSYHNHIEHWVDSDIASLILAQNSVYNKMTSFFTNELVLRKIINLFENSNGVKIKLDIGYCIDPEQNCMVDDHFSCNSWRIDHQEYLQHQDTLEKTLNTNVSVFDTLINKLFDLHKTSLLNNKSDLYSKNNPLFNIKLSEYANSVKQAIENINHIKGVIAFGKES
ncbi:site-specific integrase [Lysinibacillus fusiformis]|uniref:site-specific integrase n=1 Tax=Lysinibacillus sp. PWR01 TaxID=3342384 RepID=UPI00372D4A4B